MEFVWREDVRLQDKGLTRVLAVSTLFAVMTGCTHLAVQTDTPEVRDAGVRSSPIEGSAPVVQTPAAPSAVAPKVIVQVVENKDMIVNGVHLKNARFDLPMVINKPVEKWVDYFTGRGRKHFERYLERSEYFIPFIQPILRQNGMPEDLVYLALIESGFANNARSRAAAVGPWQFMAYTGKRYGLAVNWWVDERRDIEKSTMAAIRYLKDLYGMFNSWEMASSAYNAGESKIQRAMKRTRTTDYWKMVASRVRYLRSETRNYFPKILAAAIVVKNRTQFGFPESYQKKDLMTEAVEAENAPDPLPKDVDIEKEGVKAQPGQMANLLEELDEDDIPMDEDEAGEAAAVAMLAKQADTVDIDQANPSPAPNQVLARSVPTPHVSKRGEVGRERLAEFELQSPADLLRVAQAAGISYAAVKAMNPEISRWCTPPYMKSYRVKLPASSKSKFLDAYNQSSFPRSVRFRAYKVQRGDNLKKIARRFGIKEDPIIDLNVTHQLRSASNIRQGTELYLPIPTDSTRSIASLDLYDPPDRRHRRRRRSRHPAGKRYYRVTYKDRRAARDTGKRTREKM